MESKKNKIPRKKREYLDGLDKINLPPSKIVFVSTPCQPECYRWRALKVTEDNYKEVIKTMKDNSRRWNESKTHR